MRKWTLATLAGLVLLASTCLGGCASKYKDPEVPQTAAKPTNDPPPADTTKAKVVPSNEGNPASAPAPGTAAKN